METPKRILKCAVAAEMSRRRQVAGVPESMPAYRLYPPLAGALFEHRQLASLMAYIGFEVRAVCRHKHHPVWKITLRRGCVPKGRESHALAVSLAKFLNDRNLERYPDDLTPLLKGDRLIVSFNWNAGTPATVCYSRGKETLLKS